MRVITAAVTAAISGGALAIAYTAIEITAATAGTSVPNSVRIWAATMLALTTLGPLGLANLCRQRTILDRIGFLTDLLLTDDRAQAERDYAAIRHQLGEGDNVTRMYPKE